ncbi:toprim domain-containing protein [Paenibacillus sp. YN15]|uniref:toprim domain-containing protein n=1 Tax=Paenibacillus sp. YN15 TaxID=1742774 RepID=UPI000DCCE2CE|nr:toprim domain-containing protein [Paenibacillus sp. YN15]RAV06614.1 hypothetical protein DQG13_01950 [Paenibacillus sp. YN15]
MVRNKRAKWAVRVKQVLESLKNGESLRLTKIPKEVFSKAGAARQKQLLREKMTEVLRLANVPLNDHLHCLVHDDKNPSLVYYPKRHGLHCFGCMDEDKIWDIFDLIGFLLDIEGFSDQFYLAKRMFVELEWEKRDIRYVPITKPDSPHKTKEPASYRRATSSTKDLVYKPFDTDPECEDFIKEQGITFETAKKFGMKWWEHPRSRNRYVVIHCDKKFFVRRMYKHVTGDYKKNKYDYPENKENNPDKKVKLFNGKCLDNSQHGDWIFIVEATLDAIILEQAGFHAVALNGGGNSELILEKADVIRKNQLRLILLMDNDKNRAGRDYAISIYKAFEKQGIPTYIHWYDSLGIAPFLAGFKDVREAYMDNPERTVEALNEIIQTLVAPPSSFDPCTLEMTEELKLLSSQTSLDPSSNPLLQFGVAKVIKLK